MGTLTLFFFGKLYQFDPIVSLNCIIGEEMKEVDKNVSTTQYNLYYEARVFSDCTIDQKVNPSMMADLVDGLPSDFSRMVTCVQPGDAAKKKTVFCYLTPKVVSKVFFLKWSVIITAHIFCLKYFSGG